MIFIETSVFTKEIRDLLPDEHYRRLQAALMLRPDAGDLIQGGGGLRKIRWSQPGRVKRGALRVIYYWDQPETIFMLMAFCKSEKVDLTPGQLRQLRNLMKEWLS